MKIRLVAALTKAWRVPFRRHALVSAATLVLLACGCHSARRGEPIQGAMKISDANVARGQKVYMEHCYQCHPNGEGGLGPALNNKPLPRFMVKMQTRKGLGTMPSFTDGEISAEELEDLTDYVIALRRHDLRSAQR